MTTNFYDKVAKKFGNYSTGVKSNQEFPGEAPENVFKAKLLEVSGKDKIALDVGCADGRFTLSFAPYFSKIYAIDMSEGMLRSAKNLQKKMKVDNILFEKQDAHKMNYKDIFFDVIYDRRGPTDYSEFFRLLKVGGYFVGIEIGEKDTKGIKEVFGRGQGYGGWNNSRLEKEKKELESAGFEVVFGMGYKYDEYYLSIKDLDTFLQGVPIFEDYDSRKDKKLLEKYVSRNTSAKGINLPRHRIVVVAQKGTHLNYSEK